MKLMLCLAAGLAAGILTGWTMAGVRYDQVTAASKVTGQLAVAQLAVAGGVSTVTTVAANRRFAGARPLGLHR